MWTRTYALTVASIIEIGIFKLGDYTNVGGIGIIAVASTKKA
jgi:hypothetical protein